MVNGYLILENGQHFKGKLFGYIDSTKNVCGEIVFPTWYGWLHRVFDRSIL